MDLNGKNIIVTGASSGIGKAAVKELIKQGAKVALVARDENKLKSLSESLGGCDTAYYPYDLTDISGIDGLIKKIVSECGKLDGLVHCAGVGPSRPLNMTTYDFLHDVMLINFYAFVELVRAYSKRNRNNGGSIVVLSSYASVRGNSALTAYSASKAAVDGAVRSMAVELRQKGIRVNSVQPSWVKTEMFDKYIASLDAEAAQKIGTGSKDTIVEPEAIAGLIVFLLSDSASAVSGTSTIANEVGI